MMLAPLELRNISYPDVAAVLLFMVITEQGFDAAVFVAALREHHAGKQLDWQDVVDGFDRPDLRLTKPQFLALFRALLPLAEEYANFDIQLLWGGKWRNPDTQLSFVTAFLTCTTEELDPLTVPKLRKSITEEMFEDASDEVKAYANEVAHHPFVSLDAISALFNIIFQSQETYNHAQALDIPRTIINPNTPLFVVAVVAVPRPWGGLQDAAVKQVFYPYLQKQMPHFSFVIHGLWKQDKRWLEARLVEDYTGNQMTALRALSHAREHGWLDELIRMNNDLSIDLAAIAHSQDLFDLEAWVQETLQQVPELFPRAVSSFLENKAISEFNFQKDQKARGQRGDPEPAEPTSVPLPVRAVFILLDCLQNRLDEENLVRLQQTCIHSWPRLINYDQGYDDVVDENGKNGNAIWESADAQMNEHFKRMYGGECDVREIIEKMAKYKTSKEPAEQELFTAIIFSLFDEYNCFGEYPLEALALTAVLFGGIINFALLPRIPLQASLAMVLEAVQQFGPEDSMYKFGLQALLHFTNRLHEWPMYCERLISTPSLRGTEVWPVAEEIVRKHHAELNGDTPNGFPEVNGASAPDFAQEEPAYPPFNSIHVGPPTRGDFYEVPDEDVQDKVLFVLNNVSERNLGDKLKDLRSALQERHYQWFAEFLVEGRAKSQPNFHQLYLSMLDLLGDRDLWAEVLRESYVACFTLLNSPSLTDSSTERNYLKQLASWLGSLTIARDKPIKLRNISFKDLLLEGHDTNRLFTVITFTSKVLAQAAKSTVFKPPNPWTMEILGILLEFYDVLDLKIGLKFEIEVLCRELKVDHTDVELRSDVLRSRPAAIEEAFVETSVTEAIEGFSDMSLMALNRTRMPSQRFSAEQLLAAIPDLSTALVYPPFTSSREGSLKQIFQTAAEKAIVEIIGPVVERSITIAAISAAQLVAKDFAMESNEQTLRDAANNMVKALSGSLALVTCKEPLRMAITNSIRIMGRDFHEAMLPEGLIIMFVNDNIDMLCSIVEQQAEIASQQEIESHLEDLIKARRAHRAAIPDVPFMYPPVTRWASYIPEPYKQVPGGLNTEQLAIYEDFGRQIRAAAPSHTNNASQDSSRQLLDMPEYPGIPNIPTPAEAPMIGRQGIQQQPRLPAPALPSATPHVNGGYVDLPAWIDRSYELLGELQQTAAQAREEHVKALPDNAPTKLAFERIMDILEKMGLQREIMSFALEQRAAQMLLDLKKDLEIEVFLHLIYILSQISAQAHRHFLTWLGELEGDRLLRNRSLTVHLVAHEHLDVRRVDSTVARGIYAKRREAIEIAVRLIEDVLLSDQHNFMRADFMGTLGALTQTIMESSEADLDPARRAIEKLQKPQSVDGISTPPITNKEDQLEYIFDEWIHLQRADIPEKSRAAFIGQLQQRRVVQNKEDYDFFLRFCVDLSVAAYEHDEAAAFNSNVEDVFTHVDGLARLLVTLVIYQSETDADGKSNKPAFLDYTLSLIVLIIYHHSKSRGERFNQRVFFRLFSSMLCELQSVQKQLTGVWTEITLVMGRALLALQPAYIPSFAFGWLQLVAHRVFLPMMLKSRDQVGWDIYVSLCEIFLSYAGELVKPADVSNSAREYYCGVFRVLLVLHHDFSEFLAENHFRLCNAIPRDCTQMRNLVVSAYPSSYPELPDPFSIGLKIDRLEEARIAPTIRGDIPAALIAAGIKDVVDTLLETTDQDDEDVERVIEAINTPTGKETGLDFEAVNVNSTLVHAIVLYIGMNELEELEGEVPATKFNSPHAKLYDSIIRQLTPEGGYHFLRAMVDQLRWPNSHTSYFTSVLLFLFGSRLQDQDQDLLRQIITVLLERLVLRRPHPWGLIVALWEIMKNPNYEFWELSFVKAAPEVGSDVNLPTELQKLTSYPQIERLFSALFHNINQTPRALA